MVLHKYLRELRNCLKVLSYTSSQSSSESILWFVSAGVTADLQFISSNLFKNKLILQLMHIDSFIIVYNLHTYKIYHVSKVRHIKCIHQHLFELVSFDFPCSSFMAFTHTFFYRASLMLTGLKSTIMAHCMTSP